MKVTKELEAEITKTLNNYWDSYINGDLVTWASYLPDHYRNIGTTEAEVWHSKQEIVDYTNKVVNQLSGMAEIRDKQIEIIPYDPYLMVHELGNMYIKTESGWSFYSKLRLSSLLENTSSGWKILHQHGSFPDAHAQTGETFAFEILNKENSELRDAVKRRTAELELRNREAQIELALERVRARTMAMQHSDELAEASLVLDSQIRALGIKTRGCAFNIYGENESTEWFSSEMGSMPAYKTPRETFFLRYYEAGLRGDAIYVESFSGQACIDHYDYLATLPVMSDVLPELKAKGLLPSQQTDHVAYFKYGYLLFITLEPAPEAHDIFIRFATVFEQTYTRFLDLQKVEAQAREAQIEAALERVRARTMAMLESGELADTASVLFRQIKDLGFDMWSCGFCIWKENDLTEAWMGAESGGLLPPMMIPYKEEPTHQKIYESSLQAVAVHEKIWEGEELEKHYAFMRTIPSVKKAIDQLEKSGLSLPAKQCYYVGFFEKGYLLVITKEPKTGASDLTKRFAGVFNQTYTRFLDLQKAEKQTREAEIELALERIRARTMAMQRSDELQDAATLLFQQITSLGASTWNCSFNIWAEDKKFAVAWNATKDGFGRPFDTPSSEDVFLEFYNASQRGDEFYVREISGKELESHYAYLSTLPGVGVTLAELKKAGIVLPTFQVFNIAYFTQGYLMFITYEPVPEFAHIFKRFAKVFDQTYTRFLDLQKVEAQALRAEEDLLEIKAARKKAEDTLTELQFTQKQLIQSEKMASLGELTAGIAHEIQNPLNFVNNFSEVSTELMEEILEEIAKGNYEDVKLIVNDIKQNLEKINHHGKRADGIVKGMLQHSRTSSGQYEPTDINSLADEYLRLAYHGIRAKNKSFNASLKTDFDESIGSINIIPQDIGRVILNLITNAFYAVDQKKKALGKETAYEPIVEISTKKIADKIEITVKDNGNGIPSIIMDKIFQPFFTTKPTGEGTGLGLSMAYDIVKVHDGELKAETIENEETIFIMQLPIIK